MSLRHRAAAIVIYDSKLLVVKRLRNGLTYFVLPGGRVEIDESVEQAAERELWEETSVVGEVIKPVFICKIDNGH